MKTSYLQLAVRKYTTCLNGIRILIQGVADVTEVQMNFEV